MGTGADGALRRYVVLVVGLAIVLVAFASGPVIAWGALTLAADGLPAHADVFGAAKALVVLALPLWIVWVNGRLNDGSTGRRAGDGESDGRRWQMWDN